MTPLQKTLDFIEGKSTDTLPLHPIIMQFAAQYSGVNYRDFCLDWQSKTKAMLKCADDLSLDWVTVLSDPYTEAEAFGLNVEYPEDGLPVHQGYVINSISDINFLRLPEISSSRRMCNRIQEIEEYARIVGDKYFIVGWIEGPIAEYGDLRGLSGTCLDFYDHGDKLDYALDLMLENGKRFATAQIKAGAHCIGIGDAACSQIGPNLYRQYAFKRQKELVEHIHSLGALAKLHICGDTTRIIPEMIATGADIIDIDHMVLDISPYFSLLRSNQVFSGNSDPVEIVMRGTKEAMKYSMYNFYQQTAGRCIVSAGCEIPRQTSIDNFRIYCDTARSL